jgi:hypothetical protein
MGRPGRVRKPQRNHAPDRQVTPLCCAVCKLPGPDQAMNCLDSGRTALVHRRCAPKWDCGCIMRGDRVVTLL